MSGLLNTSVDGYNSNFLDTTGRPFATSFSPQSATASSFHQSGGLQGLHNIYGSFNVPNMAGALASRNAAMSGVPSSGVQQPGGSISSGRFATNNLPFSLSEISHGVSHGHPGVANRGSISVVGNPDYSSNIMNVVGNSIPGISSNSTAGNRSSIPGLGVSSLLQNARIGSTMGNVGGASGNIGRSINSRGLSIPDFASRVNLTANNGSGSHNVHGGNRLTSGMLQQVSQMIGMLGNSYTTSGGSLSQNQLQAANNQLSSMAMLNDVTSNDSAPFDINDFPQLTGRPGSSADAQAQLGSLRKQAVGVNSIVQQNQEFTIQNEDFPALPGFKGGSSDFPVDLHQKEQLHDVSMMQSPHFPRSGVSSGGAYSSSRQQQEHHSNSVGSTGVSFTPRSNRDLLSSNGSDLFPSSHGTYVPQIQNSGTPSVGMRPPSSSSIASGVGTYEQLMQQYQNPRLQEISAALQYRDQKAKSVQGSQTLADRFGLLGLLSVIKMNDEDLTSLALGIDLTTLGLNLSSPDDLYETFSSPWSNQPAEGEPQYKLPTCYNAKAPPILNKNIFSKFNVGTLMYIFYSMPKDEAQLCAARELHAKGWFYHKQLQAWFMRAANTEPLARSSTHERGTYIFFDKDNWGFVQKENFVLHYDFVEKKPPPPQGPQH